MLLATAALLLAMDARAQVCVMDEVIIVNLSRDATDVVTGNSCVKTVGIPEEFTAQCIVEQLEAALPPGCDERFDVYVPGTNAEHGAWKQFNYLFRSDTNRAKLSLRYEDVRTIEEDIGKLDPAKYDIGVADARASLISLLNVLEDHFGADEVRVYGHSKGSHSVALVAPLFPGFEFYAFAQPGRTDRDINSFIGSPERGRLGEAGYIEKLSNNLVGITFLNDEVYVYKGSDGAAPVLVPERWDFPGFIFQDDLGSNPLGSYRIDHHNSYGGDYTDGGNGADAWRDGRGTVGDNFPYCATGSQAAWSEDECEKTRARQRPWFWGTPACRAEAYRMMALGAVGDQYEIGYSGPRLPGTCQAANPYLVVDWETRIRWNLPDQNCRFDVTMRFEDLETGRETGRLSFSGSVDDENQWYVRGGSGATVTVPIHMNLKLVGKLIDRNNAGLFPDCDSLAESEFYINYLKLTFRHPATGERISRTVIGLDEGSGNVTRLDRDNNVGWDQPRNADELSLYFSTLGGGSLKIEGPTDTNNEGTILKRVHLVE
jgi:hypothetical protein